MDSSEEIFYKKLGTLIQRKRNVAGMNQEQLSLKLGIKRTSLTNIESGKQTIPAHLLYKLSNIFQSPIEELFPEHLDQGSDLKSLLSGQNIIADESGQKTGLNQKEMDTVLKMMDKDSTVAKRKNNHG